MLEVIPDAATATLEKFLADKVKPGGHVLSDGWQGYRRLKQKGFEHTATVLFRQDEPAHCLFPWVHITLSNLKRFLLGTHHKVKQKHLPSYVAEFNYRLNRRSMEPDLMDRLRRACISTQTITYKQLTATPSASDGLNTVPAAWPSWLTGCGNKRWPRRRRWPQPSRFRAGPSWKLCWSTVLPCSLSTPNSWTGSAIATRRPEPRMTAAMLSCWPTRCAPTCTASALYGSTSQP